MRKDSSFQSHSCRGFIREFQYLPNPNECWIPSRPYINPTPCFADLRFSGWTLRLSFLSRLPPLCTFLQSVLTWRVLLSRLPPLCTFLQSDLASFAVSFTTPLYFPAVCVDVVLLSHVRTNITTGKLPFHDFIANSVKFSKVADSTRQTDTIENDARVSSPKILYGRSRTK